MRKILLYLLDCVFSNVRSRAALQLEIIARVISWKFSNAPALLGFDSRDWTGCSGSSCIASGLVVSMP